MEKLIFWELNELNFDYIKAYIERGKLPNWERFINTHGIVTTFSEDHYEQLEPWIQWPSVRTGLSFQDHQLFRLGDIESSHHKQHWEVIEDRGYTVAAVSPINGANKTNNSPFWIPDPWVDTKISGNGFVRRIAGAIKQAVNDNSHDKLEAKTLVTLIEAMLTKTLLSSWPQYIMSFFGALNKQHWSKAIILDRLLADIFIRLWKSHRPDFSVLFLNSGAHIQHHYMLSSASYDGEIKNPPWYVDNLADPLLEVLEMYDKVLKDLIKIKGVRIIIATGLQQVSYERPIFYWRLKDHNRFLQKLGVKFRHVKTLMTRDFLLEFDSLDDLACAEQLLSEVRSESGVSMFGEIDNRGGNLFVSLTFADDIQDDFTLYLNGEEFNNFRADISFVALKNGQHHGTGYYLDSWKKSTLSKQEIPLKDLFKVVTSHFDKSLNNSVKNCE